MVRSSSEGRLYLLLTNGQQLSTAEPKLNLITLDGLGGSPAGRVLAWFRVSDKLHTPLNSPDEYLLNEALHKRSVYQSAKRTNDSIQQSTAGIKS